MLHIHSVETQPFAEVAYEAAGSRGARNVRLLPLTRAFVGALPSGLAGILLTSDLQGVVGRQGHLAGELLGKAMVSRLEELAERGDVPPLKHLGVILAGDLYSDPLASKRGVSGDVREVWESFAGRFRWVTGVFGNHDTFGTATEKGNFQRGAGRYLLDCECCVLDGLRIAGVGGITGRAGRRNRRSPEMFIDAIQRCLAENPDLLVLHEGPDNPASALRGNALVRSELENLRETVIVCGHCHWPSPLSSLEGGTQVLNVDGRGVLLLAKPCEGPA